MTADKDKKKNYSVPGLERGLAVLGLFTRDRPEWSAPDICSRLKLPRSTVFRLLQTLESLDYLVRTADGNRYRLGVAVLSIGFEYLASQSVVELGRPLIEGLSEQADLPAHLVIIDGVSIIYAVSAKPRSALASTVSVGTRLPAHATVFGRVLLGGQTPDQLQQRFDAAAFTSTTAQTPADIKALHDLVAEDFRRGFGISEGFYEPRISTVAAPVRDRNGDIVSAVGLTIAGPQVDHGLMAQGIVEQTVEAARAIAQCLGYRGERYDSALANARQLREQRLETMQ